VSSFSKSSATKELFWLTERKERKRERERKKVFESLKGEEEGRELVTQCGTNLFDSSTLNFVFVTQNTLSHTHTQEENSEWLQLQTVLISQNQQNL
jgi:hypothetical protein